MCSYIVSSVDSPKHWFHFDTDTPLVKHTCWAQMQPFYAVTMSTSPQKCENEWQVLVVDIIANYVIHYWRNSVLTIEMSLQLLDSQPVQHMRIEFSADEFQPSIPSNYLSARVRGLAIHAFLVEVEFVWLLHVQRNYKWSMPLALIVCVVLRPHRSWALLAAYHVWYYALA